MIVSNTTEFVYARRVHFYETDQMGVVHHANFLRFFEEARTHWLGARDLRQFHVPHAPITLAVVESRCWYHKPVRFEDELRVVLQVRLERVRLRFAYKAFTQRFDEAVASGETVHVPLDSDLKVLRWPKPFKTQLENETWNETWLSNLFESPKPRL